MKKAAKTISLVLVLALTLSFLIFSVSADPTSDAEIEVNFLGEKTIQLKGLSEDLVDPVANVYWEERIAGSGRRVSTYLAEDVPVVDGVIVGNTGEVLEDEREYTVDIEDRETDYETSFTFKYEIKVPQFDDVEYPCWYSEVLNYCVKRGYLSGVGNNKFGPDRAVTRAQVAQVLYAMEGKPAPQTSNNFNDVPDGKWFSDAINWAAEKKVMSGYVTGKFQPEAAITRQQFMATIYKYAKLKNYDTSRTGSVVEFSDASNITEYALPSIEWALGHKLMSGTDKHLLLPKGVTTRAQMAVILAAFDKNIVGTENEEEEEEQPQIIIVTPPQPTQTENQSGRLIIEDDDLSGSETEEA